IFGETDPAKVFYKESPINIKQADGRYVMSIHLPGTKKSDLNIWTSGDELIVEVGNYRRSIILPRSLAQREVVEAKFRGDDLNIIFGE
ncbi:MAG: hypothetical protein HQ583_10125, partial [Candidatus Abyssubacteria bacterium]|nr:hypothetical protein [Candidatus Abyssubacteria bacterium]